MIITWSVHGPWSMVHILACSTFAQALPVDRKFHKHVFMYINKSQCTHKLQAGCIMFGLFFFWHPERARVGIIACVLGSVLLNKCVLGFVRQCDLTSMHAHTHTLVVSHSRAGALVKCDPGNLKHWCLEFINANNVFAMSKYMEIGNIICIWMAEKCQSCTIVWLVSFRLWLLIKNPIPPIGNRAPSHMLHLHTQLESTEI